MFLDCFLLLLGKEAREDGAENFNVDFWEHVRRYNADGRGFNATKVCFKDLRGARQLRKSLYLEIQAIWKSDLLSYILFLNLLLDSVVKNFTFC